MTAAEFEEQAEAEIRATFPTLTAMWEALQTAEEPAPGSDLEIDDQLFFDMPTSELARQAIASAADHFDLIRLTLEANRFFISSTNGVLRGALVSSSMALWLIGPPERDIRAQRSLAWADEWYRRRIQWEVSRSGEGAPQDEAQSAMLDLLRRDRAQVRALRTNRDPLVVTDIIRWAAGHRFQDAEHVQATLSEWVRLGGDAHALGWQLLALNKIWVDPEGTGQQLAYVHGSATTMIDPYLAAWHIFEGAFHRFRQRMGLPLLA